MIHVIAGVLTFPITAALTIAGVGAAFVLIPVFTSLGIELRQAMAMALLLNALAMISAGLRYARRKLVLWKLGIPLIVTSSIGAPLGVRLGYGINSEVLTILFVCFLLFAATMIFFSKERDESLKSVELTIGRGFLGGVVGLFVGVLAGLIGVGGGNIILPVLVGLGVKPREAIGTTAVVVVFTSSVGFVSHAGVGQLDFLLVLITAVAAIAGAVVGSWLMTDKLNPVTIKKILAVVLIAFAVKMVIGLL